MLALVAWSSQRGFSQAARHVPRVDRYRSRSAGPRVQGGARGRFWFCGKPAGRLTDYAGQRPTPTVHDKRGDSLTWLVPLPGVHHSSMVSVLGGDSPVVERKRSGRYSKSITACACVPGDSWGVISRAAVAGTLWPNASETHAGTRGAHMSRNLAGKQAGARPRRGGRSRHPPSADAGPAPTGPCSDTGAIRPQPGRGCVPVRRLAARLTIFNVGS
jgi:hypothetical protein